MAVIRRPWLAIALTFAVSAAMLLRMIDLHAVNVLFFDQFDFLPGLMHGANPWQLFSWQHGRHRMGLGYLFIDAVYSLSGWDTRAEAFATAGLYFCIVALALWLKRRAVGPLTWPDLFIPAVILTRTQFELFLATPNAGHGPIALALALSAPLLWEIRSLPLRTACAALLAVCCAFTAYSMVFVPCLAAMFLFEAAFPAGPRVRGWSIAAFAACVGALALFLRGYVFLSDAACFTFPHSRPLLYLPFTGFVLLRVSGTARPFAGSYAIAGVLAVAAFAFLAFTATRALRRERTLLDRTLFLLPACSLAFSTNAAIGRVCLGMENAFVSRYVAYAIPLWLAAYFALSALAQKRVRLQSWLGAVAIAVAISQWSIGNFTPGMTWLGDGKRAWRDCYLRTRDVRGCNRETGFRVYPEENAPQVDAMLSYLAEHHLNLFKDAR